LGVEFAQARLRWKIRMPGTIERSVVILESDSKPSPIEDMYFAVIPFQHFAVPPLLL
jgi:hypothetical protein